MTDTILRAVARDAALEYANAIIGKYGGTEQPFLAAGVPEEGYCPVASTIRVGLPDLAAISVRPANGDLWIVPDVMSAGMSLPLPFDVRDFTLAYDGGDYPELRADG